MNSRKYVITDVINIIAIGGKCPKCEEKFYLTESGSCKQCKTPLVYFSVGETDK